MADLALQAFQLFLIEYRFLVGCGVFFPATHRVALGALLPTVAEDTHPIELGFLEELLDRPLALLGLAGETGHDGGADHRIGKLLADRFDQRQVRLRIPHPSHLGEYLDRRMLHRHVEIGHHLVFVLLDKGGKPLGKPIGVDVKHAIPELPGNPDQSLHQFAEVALAVPVGAIGGKILGDHVDFPDTLGGKTSRFLKDLLHRAAAELAPDQGDGAVRAPVVAPLADFQEGAAGIPEQLVTLPRVVVRIGILGHQLGTFARFHLVDHRPDFLQVTVPEDSVRLGKFLEQLVCVALGHASRHHEFGFGILLSQGEKRVDALLSGGIDKPAGIDQDQICGGDLFGSLVAFRFQLLQHHFGINLVLRASQALDIDLPHVSAPRLPTLPQMGGTTQGRFPLTHFLPTGWIFLSPHESTPSIPRQAWHCVWNNGFVQQSRHIVGNKWVFCMFIRKQMQNISFHCNYIAILFNSLLPRIYSWDIITPNVFRGALCPYFRINKPELRGK